MTAEGKRRKLDPVQEKNRDIFEVRQAENRARATGGGARRLRAASRLIPTIL